MWEIEIWAERLLAGMYLGISSCLDLKRHRISIPLSVLFGILGLGWNLYWHPLSLYLLIGGILSGAAVMLLSGLSRDSIGKGDGILLCITGIYLGLWRNLEIMFLALLLSAAAGGGLVVLKRRRMKDGIAFAPFLFAGYLIICILGRRS